jgi:hypothetical protein
MFICSSIYLACCSIMVLWQLVSSCSEVLPLLWSYIWSFKKLCIWICSLWQNTTSGFCGLMNCPSRGFCMYCKNTNLVLIASRIFEVAFYMVLVFLWTVLTQCNMFIIIQRLTEMLYTLFHNWSQIGCFSDVSLLSAQTSEEFWFSQPVLLHVCMWTGTV